MLFFLLLGGKYFQFKFLIEVLYLEGHGGCRLGLLYTLSHYLVGLMNLYYQLGFLFLLKGIDLFCMIFV